MAGGWFGWTMETPTILPSCELTYPPPKVFLKMIFLSPRWDMLVSWMVIF